MKRRGQTTQRTKIMTIKEKVARIRFSGQLKVQNAGGKTKVKTSKQLPRDSYYGNKKRKTATTLSVKMKSHTTETALFSSPEGRS